MSIPPDASASPGLPAGVGGPFLDALPLGILICDGEGRVLEANAAAIRLLGWSPGEVQTLQALAGRMLRPDGGPLAAGDHPGLRALRAQEPMEAPELGLPRPGGETAWLALTAVPLGPDRVLVTHTDVSETHRLAAILAARTRLVERAAGLSLEQLLRATLDEAEGLTGSCIGFYHFMADAETLQLQAWSTRTEAEYCRAEGKGGHYPLGQAGIWADCARQGRPLIHNDYAQHPARRGLPPGHAALVRELTVPVLRAGRLVAILGVGNKATDYHQGDVEAVQRLADLAWDLAETKRAYAAALRESDLRYATLFNAAPLGIALAQQGRYLQANPAFLKLFGHQAEAEVLGGSLLDHIEGSHRALIEARNRAREGAGTGPDEYETLGLRKDGTSFPLHVHASKVQLEGGFATLAFVSDITGRRRIEERLRESEEQVRSYIEQSMDVIFALDGEGRFRFLSPAWERHFGYPVPETLGTSFVPFVHPEDAQPLLAYLGRVLSTGQAEASPHFRVRRADGEWRWFRANGAAMGSAEGGPRFMGVAHDTTESRLAMEALQEAQQFSGQIIQSADEGIIVYDRELRYLVWNPFMEQMSGLAASQVLGRFPLEVFPFLENAGVMERLEKVLAGEAVGPIDFPYLVPATGRSGWSTDTSAPIRNLQGDIIGVIGTVRDITERKRVEDALKESEFFFKESQRAAAIGSYKTDFTTGRWESSAILDQIFGIDAAYNRDVAGWLGLVHPDDQEPMGRYLREEVLGLGRPFAMEYRILRQDTGETRWVNGQGALSRDEAGQVLSMIGTIQDITERRRTEEESRASESRFRTILDQSPVALALTRGAEVLYVNGRFQDLFGLSRSEGMRGRSLLTCVAPEGRADILRHTRRRAQGREVDPDFETTGLRADGVRFPVQVVAAPVRLGDGEATVIFITDLSGRREAEAEQARLQAQLQQAQKLESLGSLAGGVAHDMNNVLGAILGLASTQLGDQPAGSPAHQAFDTIARAATRGGKMVKGLLSFARQSPVEKQAVDLNILLLEEVRLLERTVLAGVRLDMDLAPDLPPIHGDASALSHGFMNLVVNAVDAMTQERTLTLRTRSLPGAWVEVQVQDSGSGMSREVLEKALDPFFTTKEVGKGTGLGLSIVYSTVKAHQGRMEIQSEPGLGTRVFLRFPSCATAPAAPADPEEAPPADFRRGLSVLLVDDDDLIQSSTQMILDALGHRVTPALCGEAALAALEGGLAPDVVILDLNMPGLGGAGTLPRLRALHPALPVLLATGRADQVAQALVAAHPFVTLLSKPFSLGDLKRHLEPFGRA